MNRRIILAALTTGISLTTPLAARAAFPTGTAATAPAVRDDRIAEPTEAQQTEALKIIRDIYKDDYAKHAADDRRVLAGTMFEEGKKDQPNVANKYILLRESRDISISVGDVEMAVQAAKALEESFQVDRYETLNKALASIRSNLKTPDTLLQAFTAAELNAVDAAEHEQFDAAGHAVDLAVSFATTAKSLPKASEAQALRAAIVAQSKDFDDYKAGLDTLKKSKNPASLADANLAVGLYTALYHKEWTDGLKMVVKGSNTDWANAGTLDLKNPTSAMDMGTVGDAWWDLAGKETGHRLRLLERAEYWYNLALPSADGVNQAKIEKRLETIAQGRPSYMGGADDGTKSVLPTTLELAKLKDALRIYKTDSTKQRDVLSQFQMLEGRLAADLMSVKPSDMYARAKADIDLRKLMEDGGAGPLANMSGTQPLYNRMSEYILAATSKEDLADRVLTFEKLNNDTNFMNADANAKKQFDGLVYAALRKYIDNNAVTYNSGASKLALIDFLKQKGVKTAALDRLKTTVSSASPTLGTPATPATPPKPKPAGG